MHMSENKFVRVSDISSYLICPRLAYFRSHDHREEPSPEAIRTDLLREISVSLHSVQASVEPLKALDQVYDTACADLAIAYGLRVEEIKGATEGMPGHIVAGLNKEAARRGRVKLAELLRSEATRVSLRSEKLRMSGIVDRIVAINGQLLPAVVSAANPPENGIYASDRIRLAAYGLLMAERFGCEVEAGLVEYMGGWCIREAEIRRGDRREALSIRRRIEEARAAMPDARRGKWCGRCMFKSSCVARVSFLDSLFKQARE